MENIPLNQARNCYCSLWEDNPSFLKEQNLPYGFCGFCETCNQPGHIRHAPAGRPYTATWCDKCYTRLSYLTIVRYVLAALALTALIFKAWSLACVFIALLILLFLFSTFEVKILHYLGKDKK